MSKMQTRWYSKLPPDGDFASACVLVEHKSMDTAFLSNFGYEHGDWDCFKAPYGTWRWHFIVEIEQYNLWRTSAFVAGRDAPHTRCGVAVTRVRRPRHPSGRRRPLVIMRRQFVEHPGARDANPYPEGSEDRRAWDCGYVYSSKSRD